MDDLRVEPIIGLEVHVQLATRTKMFCGCALEFGAEPNSRVCPVCLGLPGALPVINEQAVELAIRAGLALNCGIAQTTKWDRKSYYYPDLPKNYQISQYDQPLCGAGFFEFPFGDGVRRVRIRRAHLEEDAGKNVHDLPGCTGVDLNRAGTPLLEIVTEPDLRSADEAREFAVQLHRLVRYLGVSDANMQQGQMRFEPNVNVRIHNDGDDAVTPIVEVKNLNSFQSLHGAIAYELRRQVEAWRQDGITAESGNKGNRGWDDVREVTLPQREKEEAHDYRYFPDPDLVPLAPDPARVAAMRAELPELPIPRTLRLVSEYKVPENDAPALVDDRATADLLDAAADILDAGDGGGKDRDGGDKATLAKHFLSFWSRHANARQTTIAGLGVPASHVAELAQLVSESRINATAAARIADELVAAAAEGNKATRQQGNEGDVGDHQSPERQRAGVASGLRARRDDAPPPPLPTPRELAERLGLLQTSDESQITAWVDQVLAANAQAVRDALSNPKKMKAARGFLTGQVMQTSKGQADPKLVGKLIEAKLAKGG